AAALYGGPKVTSTLSEKAANAPKGWQSAAIGILDQLQELPSGEAQLAGDRLRLSASVTDPRLAAPLHRTLQNKLPDFDVSTHMVVDLPKAVARIPLPSRPCAAVLEGLVREQPVDFDTGSAKITEDSAEVLNGLAETLARCEGDPIEIGGHTDSQGAEDLNQRISEARAEAVRTALARRGVPLARLTARGYGEDEPIADNQTEAGRARNRRITFKPAKIEAEDD
ncbi:MAG: OmpA family protein, partial [Paracoccaceae bacterium]